MRVELLCSCSNRGSGRSNDDAAGHVVGATWADFWVIDGATSVADLQYVPGAESDPSWYATLLSGRFSALAAERLPLTQILRRSITEARQAYEALVGPVADIPVFAWPLAAASYVRVLPSADGLAVESLHLGDCSVFLRSEADEALALWDPGNAEPPLASPAVRADQLPHLRQRRIEQHATPTSGIAGLDPAAADHAVPALASLRGSFDIVLATDGLARLYKEYSLMTRAQFVSEATRSPATQSLLTTLRDAERRNAGPVFYKSQDDATLLAARISSDV
jgi:hypothetical protein